MTVLVTGSRGRIGSGLAGLLHDRGLAVRAASGRPEELDLPPDVQTVRCVLSDPETFPAALTGIESVFLYAEPSCIAEFIAEARAAGVKHIALLSSSAVLDPDAADNPIAASHLAVERALESAASDGSFEVTYLQPGAFATNALSWSREVRSTGTVTLPHPQSYTDPLHETDLAEAALAVLTEPSLRGSAYLLTGPESLTFTEQIAILARAAEREITVTAIPPAEWKDSVSGFIPAPFADALLDYWSSHVGSPVPVTRTVEELTGHPARTFADWARDHADSFRD